MCKAQLLCLTAGSRPAFSAPGAPGSLLARPGAPAPSSNGTVPPSSPGQPPGQPAGSAVSAPAAHHACLPPLTHLPRQRCTALRSSSGIACGWADQQPVLVQGPAGAQQPLQRPALAGTRPLGQPLGGRAPTAQPFGTFGAKPLGGTAPAAQATMALPPFGQPQPLAPPAAPQPQALGVAPAQAVPAQVRPPAAAAGAGHPRPAFMGRPLRQSSLTGQAPPGLQQQPRQSFSAAPAGPEPPSQAGPWQPVGPAQQQRLSARRAARSR